MSNLRTAVKKVPGVRFAGVRVRAAAQTAWRTARHALGRSDAEAVRAVQGIHRDQRCWIIGNGPSLNRLDLTRLRGEITFGCNCVWLLHERLGGHTSYYCVEDNLVIEDRAQQIRQLNGPLKFFPADQRKHLAGCENSVFTEFVRGEYPGFPRFSQRCDRVVFWGGTVVYMMLQLARWMGCDPIYLIGVDMDYRLNSDQSVEGPTITSGGPDVNHFHPDYFGPGKRWHDPRVDLMQRCLRHAREHLQAQGVRAYNATRGGKLESWTRVDYDEVFATPVPARPHRIGRPGTL